MHTNKDIKRFRAHSVPGPNPHRLFACIGLAAIPLCGCSQGADAYPDEPASIILPRGERLALEEISQELHEGDQGPAVRSIAEYLRGRGYFPNLELSKKYPNWRPMVPELPRDFASFGPVLRDAVIQYQVLHGLGPTGDVDARTLAAMGQPQCGHPDSSPREAGRVTEKWALYGAFWTTDQFTYRIAEYTTDGGISQATIQDAISDAFETWTAATGLSFEFVADSNADFEIRFYEPGGNPGPNWHAFESSSTNAWASGRGEMAFNDAKDWGPGGLNLESVALHEIGHTLRLDHSSLTPLGVRPVMWPFYTGNVDLTSDDRFAAQFWYDRWTEVPGAAVDIGVGGSGGNGSTWVIGANTHPLGGGNRLYRFDGTNFVQEAGAGVRIAVDEVGVPWVINDVGEIYKRSSGSFQPVSGCASDIGAGGGEVWILGCSSHPLGGGRGIFRYTGSGFESIGGAAVRIAVDSDGEPWIVNDDGDIYRRRNGSFRRLNSPHSGLPYCAQDVGAGADGSIWVTGCEELAGGGGIYTWNEQPKTDGAPDRASLVEPLRGQTGVAVAVGPDGRPWVVNNQGSIFRRAKSVSP